MKVKKIGVIGLGYVGLPLAVEFGKKYNTFGYDINHERISQLKNGIDLTKECTSKELKSSKYLSITSEINQIRDCNIYIVTVPTDIDKFKVPNLKPILNASRMIGSILKKDDIVIYESTVYPGCTEDECIPELEKASNLKYNIDFYCGYSPERINPGDKINKISNIIKITSGSNKYSANIINNLYKSVIKAGTFKVKSIKVAEAAKVIENTQRDLNIALVNELSIFFQLINIDTKEVLDAAGSKWNFLSFKPGLVGGHCIGVDPYYLTHKAKSIGYDPKIILAGRKINDKMGNYVVTKMINFMKEKKIKIKKSKILIMGLTFKENCADIRNSGVKKVVDGLKKYNCNLDIYDPWANVEQAKNMFGIIPRSHLNQNTYDGIIVAVGHKIFKKMTINGILKLCKKKHVIYDLKYLFSKDKVDLRL